MARDLHGEATELTQVLEGLGLAKAEILYAMR